MILEGLLNKFNLNKPKGESAQPDTQKTVVEIPLASLPEVNGEVAEKMKQVISNMNERDTLTLAKKILATVESGQITIGAKQQAELQKGFDDLLEAMNSKDHFRNQGHTLADADLARLDLKTSESYDRRSTFVHTNLKLLVKDPTVLKIVSWLHAQDQLNEPALSAIDKTF